MAAHGLQLGTKVLGARRHVPVHCAAAALGLACNPRPSTPRSVAHACAIPAAARPPPPAGVTRAAPCPRRLAQVIFRCDMLLLVGLVGLHLLASRRVGLAAGIGHGLLAVAASLAASVAVDSYFWRRWLWPEGEVLYFNTVLNK